jgi:3-oxoacyl-[acyl-carrier protein] reductase
MAGRLDGTVVAVTEVGEEGAAGRTYGAQWAHAAAREGARLVIGDRDLARAARVADRIAATGGEATAVALDVTSEASAAAFADAAIARFGAIDVLLNTAHLWLDVRRDDQSAAYLRQVLDYNGVGMWIVSSAVASHMMRRGRGKIVNLSSIGAWVHSPRYAEIAAATGKLPNFAYALSKVLDNGLTRFMAGALGQFGITVNAIAPGIILSEGTVRQLSPAERSAWVERNTLRRILDMTDTVGAMLFLASADSDAMTGQVLVVDGGHVMLG